MAQQSVNNLQVHTVYPIIGRYYLDTETNIVWECVEVRFPTIYFERYNFYGEWETLDVLVRDYDGIKYTEVKDE